VPSDTTTTTPPTSGTTGGNAPTTPPATTPPTATTPRNGVGQHTRCGWINSPEGYDTFAAHPTEFEAIHPKWHVMQPDGSLRNAGRTNDAATRAAARAANVAVIPLIDEDRDKARLRRMLATPESRAAHIAAIMKAVTDNDYDGIDIDYESLWAAEDRPTFNAFMRDLGAALHAAGKELSMAIPAISEGGADGYDYTALAALCDPIHVMGYDFHWLGGDHVGPLAPLGWIDAVFARAQATGHPERFILGVANYAIGNGFYASTREALTMCTGAVATKTEHMASCGYGHFDAGRATHCDTAKGVLWFDDLAAIEERIIAAKSHGARGVTYWTVGDELDGYFEMVRRYYPSSK